MKKSKIIIPALAVIAFSTVASITGTVAWFTASKTATITTGDFAVVKAEGSLSVACDYGVGTAIANDAQSKPTIVNPVTNAKISDFSFNPETKQGWNDLGVAEDGVATAYRTIGTTTSYSSQPATNGLGAHVYKISDVAYYAFTWKVTFTYTWGADHTALNIFFNYGSSTMTGSIQSGEDATTNKTQTGIRIAMVGSEHTCVFAGLQTAANLKGVHSTTSSANYGTTGLTSSSYSYFASDKFALGNVAAASATAKASYAKAIDGEASQSSRADYLGQITYSGDSDTMVMYCVAWFEGTDPNVIDENELDKVSSSLAFYAAVNA